MQADTSSSKVGIKNARKATQGLKNLFMQAIKLMQWRTPAQKAHGLLIGEKAQREVFAKNAEFEIIERDKLQREKDAEAERRRKEEKGQLINLPTTGLFSKFVHQQCFVRKIQFHLSL